MTNLNAYRFPAALLSTKPGPKGRTLQYVDVRHIAAVLDALAPGWSSTLALTHNGTEYAAVCNLIVDGITRADVGSGETPPDAANQAFRRAAAGHGLGRYLWIGETEPVPTEPWQTWSGPEDAYQWAVGAGVVNAIPHAKNALQKLVNEKFDGKMTMTNWPHVAKAFFHSRHSREAEKAAA